MYIHINTMGTIILHRPEEQDLENMQGAFLQTVSLANIVNLRQTQVWWAQQAKACMHSTEMRKDEKEI